MPRPPPPPARGVAADHARRAHPIAQHVEIRIPPGSELDAPAAEVRVAADEPRSAAHFGRLRVIVESRRGEVAHRSVERERTPAEVVPVVEDDRPFGGAHGTAPPVDFPHRRYAVVHSHLTQRRVVARAKSHAVAAKVRVGADLPSPAAYDGRGRAIVESRVRQVLHGVGRRKRAAVEVVVLVQA